jgi:hypothetical protein
MELIILASGAVIGGGMVYMYKCSRDNKRFTNYFREGSQAYVVRQHLEQGKNITPPYAREQYNIKNLGAVVDVLRKAGVEVKFVEGDRGNYYTL